MSMISYAQNFEDVMLWRVLRSVPAGVYVDVGANDPRVDSVTRWFYEQGWRGINIEPVPYWHERLVADRLQDVNLQMVVSCETGYLTLYDIADTGLATLSREIADKHQREGAAVLEIRVPSSPLDTLLAKHLGNTDIHFLKIDVEGAERDVLLSMGLQEFRPWIILVEATEPRNQTLNHEHWEALLVDRQYAFAYFDGLNRFYVANEHLDLVAGLQTPPNTFDDFMRYAEWQAQNRALELQDLVDRMLLSQKDAEQREGHLMSEYGKLQRELDGRLQQLRDIESSTSWRLTSPLRCMRRFLGRGDISTGGFQLLTPSVQIAPDAGVPVAVPIEPSVQPASAGAENDPNGPTIVSDQLLLHQISTHWRIIDKLDQYAERLMDLSCALCGHTAPVKAYGAIEAQCRFGGGRLLRYQCPECDVIFGPMKMLDLNTHELTQEYNWHYRLFSEGDSTEQELRAFHSLQPRRDGCYLNFGAGAWSTSAKILLAEGWNVVSYEPTESAQVQTGLITRREELAKLRFDGIYSNNVLEHLRHPISELRFLSSLLFPGGRMSHATPCYEYLYEYTRFHLFFYLGRSRNILANRAQLQLLSFERDGHFMNALFEPVN